MQTSTEIVPVLAVPGDITAVALTLPDHLSFEDWADIFNGLRNVSQSVMFWIGDTLLYGEANFGEQFAQVVDATEYSPETIRNAMYVSRSIPPSRRRESLSWSHHAAVAGLSDMDQTHWLGLAEDNGWSVSALRAARKASLTAPSENDEEEDIGFPKDPYGDMPKLLADAKNHECVRCANPHTVACHYSGLMAHALGNGMGKKCHDLATAYLCNTCHEHFDQYKGGNDYERCFEFLLLVMKTNIIRLDEGLITIQ